MDNENILFLGFKNASNFNSNKIKRYLNELYSHYGCILNLILLIINIILLIILFNRYKDSLGNNKFINELGNLSLYNLFKYPQISIIVSVDESNTLYNDKSLTDFIIMLRNQKLKDIEFLFSLPNNKKNYNKKQF